MNTTSATITINLTGKLDLDNQKLEQVIRLFQNQPATTTPQPLAKLVYTVHGHQPDAPQRNEA